MKFKDMSTEMTEQEIITALYMICPDSLYKRYKREKGYISVWYSLPNDTETDKHHLELLPDKHVIIISKKAYRKTFGQEPLYLLFANIVQWLFLYPKYRRGDDF